MVLDKNKNGRFHLPLQFCIKRVSFYYKLLKKIIIKNIREEIIKSLLMVFKWCEFWKRKRERENRFFVLLHNIIKTKIIKQIIVKNINNEKVKRGREGKYRNGFSSDVGTNDGRKNRIVHQNGFVREVSFESLHHIIGRHLTHDVGRFFFLIS